MLRTHHPSPSRRPRDARGIALSGATPAAAQAYERALAAVCAWREGAEAQLDFALREAPGFVMAHALRAYQLICSRDPQHHRAARPVLEAALRLRADRCERIHLAAIGAALEDDLECMRACLDDLLDEQPHDVLALQASQSIDYLLGDFARMLARVESVLRRFPAELPMRGSLLAMQAFALAENGDPARAEDAAHAALEINPFDARAHHAMAHVFESDGRPSEGIDWMREHQGAWTHGTTFLTHGWWHTALFHLAMHDGGGALANYDRYVQVTHAPALGGLIDAASLLWRIGLRGHDVSARAARLADAWEPHIDDGICSFGDLHAMLAFALAGDGARARRLEDVLLHSATRPTRHGATTRELGLPGVRALRALMRGDTMRAIPLLASLQPRAHRLGGSHAQRNVMHLTLLAALDGVRLPGLGGRHDRVAGGGRRTPTSKSIPRRPLARLLDASPHGHRQGVLI